MSDEERRYPEVWVFEENRRVYSRDDKGRSIGPIWREHWVKVEIVGETSRSWITSGGRKISKSGGLGIAFSQEDIGRAALVEKRWMIADAVNDCKNVCLLQQVAEILGVDVSKITG